MHEHSFIQAIIRNVKDASKAREVVVEVGELAGIEPDHLREHLEEETSWKVFVTGKKSKVKCGCGFVGSPHILQRLHDMVIYDCPTCHQIPGEVLDGKEIKILKVVY